MKKIHKSISHFFLMEAASTVIYTLSLHDALPISSADLAYEFCDRWNQPVPDILIGMLLDCLTVEHRRNTEGAFGFRVHRLRRSEEHTSELQSRRDLVCRLLLEKKIKTINN